MVIFKKVIDIQSFISDLKARGEVISFIPTMGALHKGHIFLVENARKAGGITVASIFVNPTQFNDKEDFKHYPISVEADIDMLTEAGCDILFLPDVSEVYPNGTENMPTYDFGYLETILEGAHRPGHFKGVGQVVARLLDIVKPDRLYMGQKDYQQCMVIKDLLRQTNSSTQMVVSPTVREDDGLAMSSRNRRLNELQREVAGVIYQCLVSIVAKKGSDFTVVKKECEDILKAKGFDPEYIELADADTLHLNNSYTNGRQVALIAAKLGSIRLIDNMLIE